LPHAGGPSRVRLIRSRKPALRNDLEDCLFRVGIPKHENANEASFFVSEATAAEGLRLSLQPF
jgi:hypothetical protein